MWLLRSICQCSERKLRLLFQMVPPRLLFPFYLKFPRCVQNVGIDMYHLSQLGTGPNYRQIIQVYKDWYSEKNAIHPLFEVKYAFK